MLHRGSLVSNHKSTVTEGPQPLSAFAGPAFALPALAFNFMNGQGFGEASPFFGEPGIFLALIGAVGREENQDENLIGVRFEKATLGIFGRAMKLMLPLMLFLVSFLLP